MVDEDRYCIDIVTQISAVRSALRLVGKLSTDAVQIKVGAPVRIDGWGGGQPIKGKVVRADPAGFLKVSALASRNSGSE